MPDSFCRRTQSALAYVWLHLSLLSSSTSISSVAFGNLQQFQNLVAQENCKNTDSRHRVQGTSKSIVFDGCTLQSSMRVGGMWGEKKEEPQTFLLRCKGLQWEQILCDQKEKRKTRHPRQRTALPSLWVDRCTIACVVTGHESLMTATDPQTTYALKWFLGFLTIHSPQIIEKQFH